LGPRRMALVANPAPKRHPLLRIHCQEGLHQHMQIKPHIQHEVLPSWPQP
jgi:hypothetical protein